MVLTYPETGRTERDDLPSGYRHVRRHAVVGHGASVFASVREGMRDFGIHRGAGMRVRAAQTPAVGGRFASGAGFGPLRIWAPCEFVWVKDVRSAYGYGFGSLPGHPVRGEEAFLVTLDDLGAVHFHIRAFSRPATWYARLGRPMLDTVQDFVTDRYLAAARRIATSPG